MGSRTTNATKAKEHARLQVALSSTNRMKRGDLGRQPKKRSNPDPSFAENEALLLLDLHTASLPHTARTLMAAATGQLWSCLTFSGTGHSKSPDASPAPPATCKSISTRHA
jgi:hypothetical protein